LGKRESQNFGESRESEVRGFWRGYQMERAVARTFQDLVVWKKAHEFVLAIYRFTSFFPHHEVYGLTIQTRRVAVSIPANIAEGFKRRGKPDKVRFMNIAQGSIFKAFFQTSPSETPPQAIFLPFFSLL